MLTLTILLCVIVFGGLTFVIVASKRKNNQTH